MKNPFGKDDLMEREIAVQERAQDKDLAGRSDGVDEQWALENQKERAELTKWQQDLSEEIKTMIYRLKSFIKNENGDWIPIRVLKFSTETGEQELVDSEQLCSDECIWRLVALLEPSTSKNLMMSKYDKPQILKRLNKLTDTVAIDILLANRKRYGVRMCDMTPIVEIFKSAAEPTFYRALNANEKDYLGKIIKDVRTRSESDSKIKPGWFNIGG